MVISSSLTSLLTLMLNICVFFVFFLISDAPFTLNLPLILLYIAELYVLVVGLALLLSALYPKFRDIHHMWEVFVQLGFWATPIIYPIAIVDERYHFWIFCNPMARIIQGCREAVIGPVDKFTSLANHGIIIACALAVFVVGLALFNKMSRTFAEDL